MESQITRLFSMVKIDEPEIEITEHDEKSGTLTVRPLLKGYGTTLGNSLRRVLLSSLPGAAATKIAITANGQKVLHEFSTIDGVKEDVTEIVLNVKGIIGKLYSDKPVVVFIEKKGEGVITAGDIQGSAELEIVNPDCHIATLSDGVEFYMELTFDNGVGYISSDRNKDIYGGNTIGEIYVDSIYTPVANVSYAVEDTRVGSSMNYDKLILNVTTNGSITSKEAIIVASQILKEHFGLLTSFAGVDAESSIVQPGVDKSENDVLEKSVEELELSVRSFNCLKRANINTVGDLINMTLDELMKIRNLGKKSLDEIIEKVESLGLSFKNENE